MIISEAGSEIEGFVIFIVRANLNLPPLGPQSSGGMNPGVKILHRPSPIGVSQERVSPLPISVAVGTLTNRRQSGYK